MLGFTSDLMIFQRIRWRKPVPDVLLRLVTCGTVPVYLLNDDRIRR